MLDYTRASARTKRKFAIEAATDDNSVLMTEESLVSQDGGPRVPLMINLTRTRTMAARPLHLSAATSWRMRLSLNQDR